jgi:predicted solute-binding protein
VATSYKVLGQLSASATTEQTLYTVPSSTQAIVSTIVIANRSGSSRTYRLAIKPTSATSLASEHYIAYDIIIAANDSTALTLGMTLAAANSISSYASSADLTFTAFGSEIT